MNKVKKEKIVINCLNKETSPFSPKKTPNYNGFSDNSFEGRNVDTLLHNNFNFFENPIIINNRGRVNIQCKFYFLMKYFFLIYIIIFLFNL